MNQQVQESQQQLKLWKNIIGQMFATPNKNKRDRKVVNSKQSTQQQMISEAIEDQDKQQMIGELLNQLKMKKTLQTFNYEKSNINKETITVRKNTNRQKLEKDSKYIEEDRLKKLLNSSNDLNFILQKIDQSMIDQEQPITHIPKQLSYQEHIRIERAIQQIFTQRKTATIPIFKTLQMQITQPLIHIDINDQQRLCMSDSNFCLFAVDQNRRLYSHHINSKKKLKIMSLKWIGGDELMVVTENHKVLTYRGNLELIKLYKPGKMELVMASICVVKESGVSCVPNVYVIAQGENYQVLITRFSMTKKNLYQIQGKQLFRWNTYIKSAITLRVLQRHSFTKTMGKDERQKNFVIMNDIWNYYSLTQDSKKIVRFDSVVNKCGVMWTTQRGKIKAFAASACNYYVYMVIENQMQIVGMQKMRDHFQFVKLSSQGSIAQRVNLNTSQLQTFHMFSPYDIRIKSFSYLEPEWLCCAALGKMLIYFSLQTGQVVYTQQIGESDKQQIKIRAAGSKNSIVFQQKGILRLLSTQQKQKTNVLLEYHQSQSHDELLRRFQRIQGLPQNLLRLLQSIHNNHP